MEKTKKSKLNKLKKKTLKKEVVTKVKSTKTSTSKTKKDLKNDKGVKSETKKNKSIREDKENSDKQLVFAYGKYFRTSAQKARLVVDLIKGKNTIEALSILKFTNKRAVEYVKKVLDSAIANAVNNFQLDKKNLYIKIIQVDDAPIIKRGRSGSRGRYQPILKRNCHITIGLESRN